MIYKLIISVIICILILLKYCCKNNKIKFSLMAIFKNEEQYLEEWLKYHISQGIEHFYLYCNDPNIEKYDYLYKYEKYITLIEWTDKKNISITKTIQKEAYKNCIQTFYNDYDYIMMLDIDEFLVNKNGIVIDYLNSLDKNKTKALKIPRFNFGSNGHVKKPEGNVMDNYKTCENICSSYKTIANINFVVKKLDFFGVHDFNLNKKNGKIYNNYFVYDFSKKEPIKCNINTVNETPLIINHYFTKSYDEYLKRCSMWKDGGVNNIHFRNNCEENFKKYDY